MKKIGLVMRREYLRRVNKKSFILLTLLMPVISVTMIFVPLWLSSIKSNDVQNIVIVDHTKKYADLFKDTGQFHFVSNDINEPIDQSLAQKHSSYFAFIEITDDLLEKPDAITLYSDKQIPPDLTREVERTLRPYLENEKRASFNIPNLEEIIRESHVRLDVRTIKWGKDGAATESSSGMASAIGMIFTIIIYIFILMYGSMVMQSVVEEKTNRIVEVMISSVRPFDLMMGKIIGVGLVGLTQLFIWGLLTFAFLKAASMFLGMQAAGAFDITVLTSLLSKLQSFNFIEIIVCFALFFIGGYVSYASLYTAVGAVVDTPEDAQQFFMPIMMFLIFAIYAGMYSAQNPDGPLAYWCSLIPFTSPIVMMVRVPYDIPLWQILVSLTLLYGSAILSVWFSAKIYRVGILMYGKKPTFKEIARWVKYG